MTWRYQTHSSGNKDASTRSVVASTAATGAMIGAFGGPVGAALGAGIGGLVGWFAKTSSSTPTSAPTPAPTPVVVLPPFKHVSVNNLDSLRKLHDDLWSGAIHPRACAVQVTGPMAQTVSKAYNALYKVRGLRRRGEMVAIAASIEATAKSIDGFIKPSASNLVAPLTFIAKELGDSYYQEDHFTAALCLPCADIVCSILVAGLHLAHNDGDVVMLTAEGRRSLPPHP
ncbi:hypothetical protein N825_28920 [Skermanella stibiiresistens SB22]|uniref:Glycine zipper domain-containing protein n=1 Tax=Skermanella stibiiresistens SB22 TaxID=1385369 RepID=W9GV31_9PROT|nr:hypothetical protein [Skermanella stibiiresistens]EWY36297.1 hypothetical protein N825_28920 [Skermanella stibiiresistens SB22]